MISPASNPLTPQYLRAPSPGVPLQLAESEQREGTVSQESLLEEIAALRGQIAKLSREQTNVQDLFSSLGFALRSFNNLNQFLELTPLMAARVADAEGGALLIYRPNGTISVEKIYCGAGDLCGLIQDAFEQTHRYELTTATDVANPEFPGMDGTKIDALVQGSLGDVAIAHSTPILVKNQERGRLYVFSSDPNYAWDVTRRKLVQVVADQTAVAIANNDLTSKLRKQEKQDQELQIASEIQTHLLPRECPQIKGLAIAAKCRNAYRVGGDYYDFIPSNYDRIRRQDDPKLVQCVPWSIVIGDVMGKGVPAGLIMTMTRGMLRAEVLNRHSPAKVLNHLNRVMYPDLDNSHRFVTLFYSEYDPKTRTLSYCNAAHHPALLWRAQHNTLQKLDTWGMLIGLDLDSDYEEDQVVLEPGDIVLYYTDGFTDAVNAHGDRFDEENLNNAFQSACQTCQTPDEIVDTLFKKVEQFTYPNVRNGDDMTLVVVQVQSEAVDPEPCNQAPML